MAPHSARSANPAPSVTRTSPGWAAAMAACSDALSPGATCTVKAGPLARAPGQTAAILGLIARHPLTRIPENALKFAVGVLISSFGTFWVGEGMRIVWPWGDYSLIVLSISYAIVAAMSVVLARSTVRRS